MHEQAWLLSIARNVCLSRTDAARRRAVEVAQDPHALEETIAAPAPPAELDGLTDALATLTEQQRHAILLREWHGLAYSEIAEQLELSQAAVETLLFRARRSLARRLRQPLGIGSFVPWLRSLGEGGAAKVALGAAAVAVTATTGAGAIVSQRQHQPGHAMRTRAVQSAPTSRAIPNLRRVRVAPKAAPAKHHVAPANATSAPAQQAPAIPAQPHAGHPVASAPTAPGPEPLTATQTFTNNASTTATTTTATAAPVVDTVSSAAAAVTNTASSIVSNTADTVANTTTDVVATAQAAIATVTNVVPAITAPLLP